MPPEPSDCVTLLQGMVSFDTVTHEVSGDPQTEKLLAEWIASFAESWGLQPRWLPVEGFGPNLLLTHETDPQAPWRLFDSHLDTVGVGGMTIDPFSGEVREERLWARGACDTKGSGAAMLWAAKEWIASGASGSNLAILLTVGEEHAQVGARSFVENDLPSLSWRPQAVVVGEPTRMRVVSASNGFVRWLVTTHGKAAHSSTPERGHNAVIDMARAALAIVREHIAKLTASHPLTGRGTCSINEIRGGVQHNIVPDYCEAQIDQRLTPGESADDALSSVRGVLERIAVEDPEFRFGFKEIESAPPFASEASTELATRVAACLESSGVASGIEGAPYTTNANHYAPAGLPCVVLGPGDIAQAHIKDEWIALEQLALAVRGYRALMEGPL